MRGRARISAAPTRLWWRISIRTPTASACRRSRATLLVNVPGYGKKKINAAYPIGDARLARADGPALMKETVGELVGLPIDHFVLINFDWFFPMMW